MAAGEALADASGVSRCGSYVDNGACDETGAELASGGNTPGLMHSGNSERERERQRHQGRSLVAVGSRDLIRHCWNDRIRIRSDSCWCGAVSVDAVTSVE